METKVEITCHDCDHVWMIDEVDWRLTNNKVCEECEAFNLEAEYI